MRLADFDLTLDRRNALRQQVLENRQPVPVDDNDEMGMESVVKRVHLNTGKPIAFLKQLWHDAMSQAKKTHPVHGPGFHAALLQKFRDLLHSRALNEHVEEQYSTTLQWLDEKIKNLT